MDKKEFFTLENYTLRLVLLMGAILFLIKFFFSKNYWGIFANSLFDFLVLIIIYLIFSFIEQKTKDKKALFLTTRVLFFITAIFHFIVFSVNSLLLDRSIQMKFTMGNLNISNISIVLTDLIHVKYLAMIPIIIGLICFAALANPKFLKKIQPYLKISFIILIILSIIVLLFSPGIVSNMYTNTISEKLFKDYVGEVSFTTKAIQEREYNPETFDKRITDYSDYSLPEGKKVLLFIMEEISYPVFESEIAKIPEERNFFKKTEKYSHLFSNYYTTNQDSRTSIWVLLGSHYIPFECYIKDWINFYGYVLEEKNIVDLFNQNNYHTQAIAALSKPITLMRVHNWTDVSIINSPEETKGEYFCLDEFEFLFGCEDNAVIDEVKEIIKDNKDKGLFLMQELIYGHGSEYYKEIGKSRIEYYNDYLLEIYEFLEKEEILEDAFIVIISDHGEKGDYERKLQNYQIPLVIINPNLEEKEIKELYTHLDFKEIIVSYLNEKEPEMGSENIYFVGQTGKSKIGYVDKEGNYFLGKFSGKDKVKLSKTEGLKEKEITKIMQNFIDYRQKTTSDCDDNKDSCGHCSNCNNNIINAMGELVPLPV
ncbi:sulfatase-like hydrolase/transferase [Nanoarchaeota archaeon]